MKQVASCTYSLLTFHETTVIAAVVVVIVITAPSVAPRNFRRISITATTITFQWDNLIAQEANGIVRNFTVACTRGNLPPSTVSVVTINNAPV